MMCDHEKRLRGLAPVAVSLILTLMALVGGSQATVIGVPADQPTIQAGIDAAFDGDTVLIASGTYTGDGNRDMSFLGKNIVVMSENGADFVTVDCESIPLEDVHRGFVFANGETSAAVLQGITITRAYADTGGGVLVSGCSPVIRDCRFLHCGVDHYYDFATNFGAGAACVAGSEATFENCLFKNGGSNGGGGMAILSGSDVTVTACQFDSNSAMDFLAYGRGSGGAFWIQNSSPTITDCSMTANWAWEMHFPVIGCPGMCVENGSPVVSGCTFDRNYPGFLGIDAGGVALWAMGGAPVITNCTFVGNCNNNCYHSNTSPGIMLSNSAATISHCIFANNNDQNSNAGRPPIGWQINESNPLAPTITCNVLYRNEAGDFIKELDTLRGVNGNVQLDPRFCDTAASDFHLAPNSWASPDHHPCGELVGAWAVDSTCPEVACCIDARGNVDDSPDDLMSLGDLTAMIDILYISMMPPNCWEEANIDASQPEGEGSLTLGDLTALINYLFISFGAPPLCP